MPKILFVATVPEHFRYFHLPCFKMLQEHGYEVHTVCGKAEAFPYTDKQFVIPIGRSPFDPHNVKGLRQLQKIIREGQYDIIHAHTPTGGALARIAAVHARKSGTRVLYTAHGFHFYKGASLLNWFVLFPVEWILSFLTDTILTINTEDYGLAQKRLHAKRTVYIHGVGCDTAQYRRADEEERAATRAEWGVGPDDPLLVYVAELNENKHQDLLIRAVTALQSDYPRLRLLLVGPDHIGGVYMRLTLQQHAPVIFTGERHDIPRILACCDMYAASSLREGLPVNIMEAMAAGLPVVAMRNRGHCALVQDGETGFLVDTQSQMEEKLCLLLDDAALRQTLGENAKAHVADFDVRRVLKELEAVYFQ